MAEISIITPKGRTAIPRKIRTALNVKPGDLLAWVVSPSWRVEVRCVQPVDQECLRALEGTMSEWADTDDEKAYRDL